MPNYRYGCENCSHEFEIYQTLDEPKKKKCPECKKYKLERLIGNVTLLVKPAVKTIGHQASRNRDKFSTCERQELGVEKTKEVPWWRKGLKDPTKPLNVNKIKNVKKYIETGDTGYPEEPPRQKKFRKERKK